MKNLIIILLLLTACKKEPKTITPIQPQAPIERLLNVTTQNAQFKIIKVNNIDIQPPIKVFTGDILYIKCGGTPNAKNLRVDIYIDGTIIDGTKQTDVFERTLTIQ